MNYIRYEYSVSKVGVVMDQWGRWGGVGWGAVGLGAVGWGAVGWGGL